MGHLALQALHFLKYQHEQAYLLAKGNPILPKQPTGDAIHVPYSRKQTAPDAEVNPNSSKLIRSFTNRGDLVLDPFCGSGSSLLAAKILKRRRYLGIEVDPANHAAATQRLQPDGVGAGRRLYPPLLLQALRPMPLLLQASRPMPPLGGALITA